MNADKIEQFSLLAKGMRGLALSDLITKATAEPGVYTFGELLALPQVQSLAQTDQAAALSLLRLSSLLLARRAQQSTSTGCVPSVALSLCGPPCYTEWCVQEQHTAAHPAPKQPTHYCCRRQPPRPLLLLPPPPSHASSSRSPWPRWPATAAARPSARCAWRVRLARSLTALQLSV